MEAPAVELVAAGKPATATTHAEVDGASSPPPPDGRAPDVEQASTRSVNPLRRRLENRHMQMIAIGGAIGAGLFVGSGGALHTGGPGAVLVGYVLVGVMLQTMVQSLAEMAVLYPVNGSFYTYVCRFVDPSMGFAVGWVYALVWLSVLPFELTGASLCIAYWRPNVSPAIFTTVFLVVLAAVQTLGVRGYGEVEFVLGTVKLVACAGFVVLGIVIDCGGVGDRGALGARYWHDPGAFHNGLRGVAAVFVVAALSMGGTEMVGLAAAESADPDRAIPRASRQVFWRITLVYVLNLFVLGLVVSSADPRLLGASGANTKASPFVLAIRDAGIRALPSVFNGVILLAVLSVANSCTFGSSRTLQALAARGMAPRCLAYVDPAGRPLWCIVLQLLVGGLAYVDAGGHASVVFGWLTALSGVGFVVTWSFTCLAHIRFRLAWAAQGRARGAIPCRARLGVYGSGLALAINVLAIGACIYAAFQPAAGQRLDVAGAVQQVLVLPIFLVFYVFWKLRTRAWALFVPLQDVDLDTGLNPYSPEAAAGGGGKKRTWKSLPVGVVRGVLDLFSCY